MKRTSLLLIAFAVSMLVPEFAKAQIQKVYKHDTVYYFVDIANTPVKDRLIDVVKDADFSYYLVKCHCYQDSSNALFSYPSNVLPTTITKKQFKEKKLVSLPTLLRAIHKSTTDGDTKYEFFFIEPNRTGSGYQERKVLLNNASSKISD